MTLKDNYLRLSKKMGGPYYIIKKGIKRGWIDSILQGNEIGVYKAYEISKILGVTLEELYPGWTQAERISEHPEIYGMPGYPYSPDERHYIGLLTEILRGDNKENAKLIRGNITAFYKLKDTLISAADCPDAAPKKTAENGK